MLVAGDSLEVQGLYRFVNRADRVVPLSLFYPFPADSLLGPAHMVSLVASPDSAVVSYTETTHRLGAIWRLRVPASDMLVVRCVYRQRLLGRFARYIVTTTLAWQEPLRHARFEIVLPEGARAPTFSYPFRERPGLVPPAYVFEVRDFLPEAEIEVRWDP